MSEACCAPSANSSEAYVPVSERSFWARLKPAGIVLVSVLVCVFVVGLILAVHGHSATPEFKNKEKVEFVIPGLKIPISLTRETK